MVNNSLTGKEESKMTKRKILIYGDSNTYGYDPADLYELRYPKEKRWTTMLQDLLGENWTVLPEGMNGRQIPDPLYDGERIRRLVQKLSENDLFAVMLGTNDILLTMNPDAEAAIRKMDAFLDFLVKIMPPEELLLIAPPHIAGSSIRHAVYRSYYEESAVMNEGFGRLADQYGTMFADAGTWEIGLSADLVHFSEEGHRVFASRLALFLQNVITEAEFP